MVYLFSTTQQKHITTQHIMRIQYDHRLYSLHNVTVLSNDHFRRHNPFGAVHTWLIAGRPASRRSAAP